ncbi:MFS transporter [Allomesorhizobium alhagi]|jgi:sugar phosphate permease|uniref:Major facilitator transporter n=1 Tax=Mesorhizobium alhagi CCNWXJ12-2 TaxID=1107882 RepID=H0HW26_9HYPH|nr:MFS transporter [Mesorhizobium alhagi]EHK55030.1 major facilitator transporter [Mesorhizobium alhagi CCNWXJ12-2]
MSFLAFLRENARWLAGGFLLTLFSSFGQTFFISLSAGNIREEYGLSHGGFGTLYMVATLGSALTLPHLGQIVDRYSVKHVALFIIPMLALAAVSMAFSTNVLLLAFTIYLLRLFGQGMLTHTSFTAMGRWFSAQRGRAVSVVTLGHNTGEAIFPLIFVAVAVAVGWRNTWLMAAAALVFVALPVIVSLIAVERAPRASDPVARVSDARDWTRAEALRDPVFYLLFLGVMAPSFIGTVIFFHQVYLVELRGWSLELFAGTFTLMAVMTATFALISGQLIDRFSAVALLPSFLIPLGLACLILGLFEGQWSAFAFMALLGVSWGFSSTLFGALWPEIYGTRHLGSIRALAVAIMVFASAMGPGLTGLLIDLGVSYPGQIIAMGVYCFAISLVMLQVSRRVRARATQPLAA